MGIHFLGVNLLTQYDTRKAYIYHATNSTVVLNVLKTSPSREPPISRPHWLPANHVTEPSVLIGGDVTNSSTCVLNNCCVMER